MVTLLYKRQNMIEEVIADLFSVSQGTVSEIITEGCGSSEVMQCERFSVPGGPVSGFAVSVRA